jgi:hypothetical protein
MILTQTTLGFRDSCSSAMYMLRKYCRHLHELHKKKSCVPKMVLICVPEIFDLLSLSVVISLEKLFSDISNIVIRIWSKLFIETKK